MAQVLQMLELDSSFLRAMFFFLADCSAKWWAVLWHVLQPCTHDPQLIHCLLRKKPGIAIISTIKKKVKQHFKLTETCKSLACFSINSQNFHINSFRNYQKYLWDYSDLRKQLSAFNRGDVKNRDSCGPSLIVVLVFFTVRRLSHPGLWVLPPMNYPLILL